MAAEPSSIPGGRDDCVQLFQLEDVRWPPRAVPTMTASRLLTRKSLISWRRRIRPNGLGIGPRGFERSKPCSRLLTRERSVAAGRRSARYDLTGASQVPSRSPNIAGCGPASPAGPGQREDFPQYAPREYSIRYIASAASRFSFAAPTHSVSVASLSLAGQDRSEDGRDEEL
jgi:hypothetical protein